MPRIPVMPTAEEIAAHKCTHLPHRDWCEVCVQARAREDRHFRNKDKTGEKDGLEEVGMDYKSVGRGQAKLIIMRDKHSRTTFAHVVECKGPGDDWAVRMMEEDIRELGHTDIELKVMGSQRCCKCKTNYREDERTGRFPSTRPHMTRRGMGSSRERFRR